MRNVRSFIVLFSLLLFSSVSWAQDLVPFINFLRSTPAFINGTVQFTEDSVLFDDGWTVVKLLKNQPIAFIFKEDYLEVRLQSAFHIKSYKVGVKVEKVSWSPKTGIQTTSAAKVDITGLSSRYVSGKVAEALKDLFEQRIIKANQHLKRVRTQASIGNIFEIAKTIVKIFTASYGSSAGNINIPSYRGEIGLNFLPPVNKAFNLYGMRVGIRGNDYYRTGFRFTGNTEGIYPYAVELESRDGVDVNYGKEFKLAARLILKHVSVNRLGTGLEMHLGASQVIGGILSAVERAAQMRDPGARCENCAELATFPSIRVKVEKQVRTAIVTQVKELWPMIQGLNINPKIYSAFNRREQCRITGLNCVDSCSKIANGTDDRKACKEQCERTQNICLK